MRPVPTDIRAGVFAYYGHHKRRLSLRQYALVTATYYRHFPLSGTYAESRCRGRRLLRMDLVTMAAALSSEPGDTGSLSL